MTRLIVIGGVAAGMSAASKAARQAKGMLVEGAEALPGGQADSRGNGEIAMLVALAASVSREPVILAGAEAAEAVWPGFWQEYRRLGGRVEAV